MLPWRTPKLTPQTSLPRSRPERWGSTPASRSLSGERTRRDVVSITSSLQGARIGVSFP